MDGFAEKEKNILLKTAVGMLYLFSSFPGNCFHTIKIGSEGSWVYALNLFSIKNVIYGEDVIFTYGPLGFLAYTENIGNNLFISVFFWCLLLCLHGWLLYQFLLEERCVKEQALVLTASVILYMASNITSEYYLCYLGVLALMIAWKGNKRNIWISEFVLIMSFYIKMSSFFVLFSAFFLFLSMAWLFQIESRKYYTATAVLSLALLPVFYLFFFGRSVRGFIQYIYGSMQIASGYNVAMSYSENDVYVIWVVLIIILYLLCSILCYRTNKGNFAPFMILAGPLFFMYKHGFVRADAHVNLSFAGLLWALSLLILFLDWEFLERAGPLWKKIFWTALAVTVVIPLSYTESMEGMLRVVKNRVIDFPSTVQDMVEQDTSGLVQLPEQIMRQVGTASVSIYPWEVSYVASNALNYAPMPTIQAYSAYTPYLDRLTADFYSGEDAPQYIILTRDTIDDRWAFIECPKTRMSIKNHYKITCCEGEMFLLQKRELAEEKEYMETESIVLDKTQKIDVNGADGYMKVTAKLNWKGQAAKLFWKIPEVRMTAEYEDGSSEEHRILLDNLANGTDLSSVTRDKDTFVDYMNYHGNLSKVKSISFSGDGLEYYKTKIKVTWYASGQEAETLSYPIDTYPLYSEKLGPDELSFLGYKEVSGKCAVDTDRGNGQYRQIVGWGFAESGNYKDDVYVKIGDSFYRAKKTVREDAARANDISYTQVGFELLADANSDTCDIYFVNQEEQVYFKTGR